MFAGGPFKGIICQYYTNFAMEECVSLFVQSIKKFFNILCQPAIAGPGLADTQCTLDYILAEGKTTNQTYKTILCQSMF
jgi:hypothetical protein